MKACVGYGLSLKEVLGFFCFCFLLLLFGCFFFLHCIQHQGLNQAVFFLVLGGSGSGCWKGEMTFSFTLKVRI